MERLFFTGYTPYPFTQSDERMPHIARKVDTQIRKTALGAEKSMPWAAAGSVMPLLKQLKNDGYLVCGLEQTANASQLPGFKPGSHVAIIVGNEITGLEPEVIEAADICLQIPMLGTKESYNVVQAAAMALYHCRFMAA